MAKFACLENYKLSFYFAFTAINNKHYIVTLILLCPLFLF